MSSNGYYIQIQPIAALPVQVTLGQPLHISVESTFQLTKVHYVVTSGDRVVAAGTQNSASFHLSPTASWVPRACVTVFCVQPDGEITNHAVHIPVLPRNHASLNWSSDTDTLGDEAAISVAVSEPGSLVGVMVQGMEDPAPGFDHDVTEEKGFNHVVLTDARLQKTGDFDQFAMAHEDTRLMSEKYWRGVMEQDFTKTWLWVDGTVRGEQLVLEVNISNNLKKVVEMVVVLADSDSYTFVLAERGDISTVNARKFTIESQNGATVLFPIRPLVLGKIEISVYATSAEASDTIARTMLVKAEGIEQAISETLFLELAPTKHNFSTTMPSCLPADVVPGSQRAHLAVVGDILGLSINSLDSLVQIPHSCGEQNMVHFAPNVYILQFLDKSPQGNQIIQDRTLQAMMGGYQRQLSYQRDDGSFSAFGNSDTSGSTWLTAFVLRCFLQSRPFIQVDQSVMSTAMVWLVGHQGPQGSFTEPGRIVHTELQGGLEDSTVALTAYVLMTLLEDTTYVATFMSLDNISLTRQYLEHRVNGGVSSNYSLCLMFYALALANSPVAATAWTQLTTRAEMKDGVMTWSSSRGEVSDSWQASSVQIEMASYVLLALYKRASIVEGINLMKWLSKQRNYLGGYGTTQDTVIAIQALSYYAAFSGSDAINLRISTTSGSHPRSQFIINSTSYLLPQSQEIDAEKDLFINMEGRGFALLQRNVFYNLKSSDLSQKHQNTDHEGFSLKVNVTDNKGDLDHMVLSICTRLLESQMFPQTGMVLVDVSLLSGFILQPNSVAPGDLIRKVETFPGRVSLYLDSLNTSEVCFTLPLIRAFRVALLQDAVVQVYDYYEPRRRAVRTYNSDLLHNMDSCSFCGRNCKQCGSGISRYYTNSSTASITISTWD
ncbi:CD109 antigen-like [Aplochiton taeniatus]